ncbi:MAG: 4-hydroxy-tetrahydrodipicolinate reductase [Saprospiraceae bacterium]|jgi:4-hydroxy-tetrahydrodipicolinate reductase|uniref:4-hydroxy-tetrahydrodipicolinate reductase n=1 Tax=Patiriisocius sp. Uisw_047 TaxID=3230969 RepID=UPI0039E9F0E4
MKIAILGYGKMGKTIERLAKEKGHEIVYTSSTTETTGELKKADVAIEFSTPERAVLNITQCFNNTIPVVSGTTGWLDNYNSVIEACKNCNGSFIYASNFSVGVNIFFDLNNYLAKLMEPYTEYIPHIEEIHHTEKKDAPSGTAITLAEDLLKFSKRDIWALENNNDDVLNISAKRIADVKGTHTVSYESKVDTLRITHEAHSRDGFALGAILAAEWLTGKKGVFTMKDVLGMK